LKSIETTSASSENKPFLRKYNSNDSHDGFRDSHDHDDDNDDEDYGNSNGNYDNNKRFQSKYYDANTKYLSPWKLQNTGLLGQHNHHYHYHYHHYYYYYYQHLICVLVLLCTFQVSSSPQLSTLSS